jgi:transposase
MRDKFVERMTWFAEYAPDKQTADYVWRIIMDVKGFQVTPEDAAR